MKTAFRRVVGLALAALFTIGLAGCGSSGSSTESYTSDTGNSSEIMDSGNGTAGENIQPSDRKVVYTSSVDMECKDVIAAGDSIRADAAKAGGYVESSSRYTDTSTIYLYITVRIPVDQYQSFMESTETYGDVTSKSENSEDITSQYVDVQARIKALEAQRERLTAMEETATDLDTLLQIESQLSEVQYQIESYTSQKNAMDSQTSYSTVDFSLIQPLRVTPVSDMFGDRAAAAFFNGWAVFWNVLQDIVIALIALNPLILLVILILVIVHLVKRYRKKHNLDKPKQPKPQPQPNYASPYGYPRNPPQNGGYPMNGQQVPPAVRQNPPPVPPRQPANPGDEPQK